VEYLVHLVDVLNHDLSTPDFPIESSYQLGAHLSLSNCEFKILDLIKAKSDIGHVSLVLPPKYKQLHTYLPHEKKLHQKLYFFSETIT